MRPSTPASHDSRIAIIELRCLLVSDAPIKLDRRQSLIRRAAGIVKSPIKREQFVSELTKLVVSRNGRNPDNSEPSAPTKSALGLLDAAQRGLI